jgi:hypothetical protein
MTGTMSQQINVYRLLTRDVRLTANGNRICNTECMHLISSLIMHLWLDKRTSNKWPISTQHSATISTNENKAIIGTYFQRVERWCRVVLQTSSVPVIAWAAECG